MSEELNGVKVYFDRLSDCYHGLCSVLEDENKTWTVAETEALTEGLYRLSFDAQRIRKLSEGFTGGNVKP